MGNTTSGEEGRHRLGYHVLRVKDGSPAHKAGIKPFFDYIVAINGVRLNTEGTYLQDQMRVNEDSPVILDIYSTREQAGRRVEMVPTKNWGDGKGGLIGCSIRFCMFDAVNDVVWHILDVAHGSPAEKAGLCAHSDYVIGTPYGIMRGEGDLYDLVEDNIGEPLRLHVYNTETDHVREIIIIPNEEWGGEGLLGCDVGYGYLHRLPRQGSTIHHGSGGSTRRTPSLPYPSSQEMIPDSSYNRNTMPASFQSGQELVDIVAPTPRPSQSPSWLNPTAALEGTLQRASDASTVMEEPQDLPPLRFGRGERPDAEDEPESEDEFVPKAHRGPAPLLPGSQQQDLPSIPATTTTITTASPNHEADFRSIHAAMHEKSQKSPIQPTSPSFLRQIQTISVHDHQQISAPRVHDSQPYYQGQTTAHPLPEPVFQPPVPVYAAQHQQQQNQHYDHVQTGGHRDKALSTPPRSNATDINTGDIPFGAGDSSDFASTFGMS